ncbi:NFX1-type zinc finger-containing protein 1-like [Acanthaster planci]|uniref:NFX1-type zinc finger-containing protein 1-like n=1 Tax=Acanthaster planci TaxID=133434 RepID=A0A8B7YKQ4_ACAPL|nr:NFX1-type zinc finger-containing protein 1-like [Acanthaster planci]
MEGNPFRVRGFRANQGGAPARGRQQEDGQARHQGYQRRVDNQHGQERGRGGYGRGRGQERGRGGGYFRNAGQHHQEGGAKQRERPVRQPGYKMLESLLDEEKCAAEVVQELTSFGKGLESLLSERDIRRDMMALLVRVLGRVCDCEDSPQSVVRVLNVVVDTDFLSKNLSQHINSMVTEFDERYLRRVPNQIASILKLMQTLIQRIQNTMKDVHVVLTLMDVVTRTLETKGYPLESESKVLLSQLLLCCEEREKAKKHKSQRQRTDQEAPPPNDFREIPIFPDVAEITTNAEAYLRANVVHGKYRDLNHYLDVQFRLLRQDFLEPLQQGIAEYHVSLAQTNMNRKLKDIRIYHDVGVHFPICTNDGITHRVSFDVSKFRKVRWQATKRLTFGSLVCLSKDNFQSVIFATVANRKPEELEQGLVDLRFQDMTRVSEINSTDSFIMAESSAYFEAYRHVLQGLQEVRGNSLPLQRYIIEVSCDVKPPQYLRHDRFSTYDLSPLTHTAEEVDKDDESKLLSTLRRVSTKASAVQVLTPSTWPQAETLHLDDSQLQAVKAALTQELAVIQGPPGTGKTYIGLKIVQALLYNSDVWNEDEESNPILVVCYTNHALDQFLEGIMKFNQNIVRVGGRSNSEDMKNKNLNFLKREQRRRRDVQRTVHIRTSNILREMYSLRQCMEVSQRKVERSMNGIINEDYLQPFMSKEHYATLTVEFVETGFHRPTPCILEWLGLSGHFRVATAQEVGMAAFMGEENEPEEPEEEEQEEEEIEVAEEADAIADQRVLDDDDEDMFLFEEDPQENHLVLDIEQLAAAQPLEEGWQMQPHQKKRMRKMLLHNLRKSDRMTERDAQRIKNVWAMRDINSRWQLYRYWVSEYCKNERKVCGHQCTALCTRECPPCAQKCQNQCVHSKCPNRCGDPCTPCQEPCPWRCPHYRCRKKCSEACDRPPCNRPCPARLRCGHPCIGLCGEPCPDKCRVCHRDEVTEIFFGSEDEPDARFVQLEDCSHVFDVDGLDQWMQVTNEGQKSIQLKVCPRCKTPIRRNLRYGKIINETLADIEKVKERIFGNKQEIEQKKIKIRVMLYSVKAEVDTLKDRVKHSKLGLAELIAIENQLLLLEGISKLKRKAEEARNAPKSITELRMQKRNLVELEQWLLKPRIYVSQQELDDCSREVQRLSMCFSFFLIKERLQSSASTCSTASLTVVEKLLLSGQPLDDSSVNTAKTLLEKLRKQCTGLGISESERIMIVKAMGMSQGHWYKCPNGHCYAIGDCGGANQESRCPECKAKIGGMSHRLAEGNAVATEMDGARYGAFSDQANMDNYDPVQLQNLFGR